jgi:acarbose 7IV-phosphotransferase
MKATKKILILGGSSFDHIVYLKEFPQPLPQTIHKAPFREACGSTGTGKALALTKLDVPNVLYTAYGNDYYGEKVERFLYNNEVKSVVVKDHAGTQRHFNIMDAQGQRISMFITQSSETLSHDYDKVAQLIDECDIIVLNIIPYCLQLLSLIKTSGKPVWTDLHDYDGSNSYHQPFIEASQYIHLSADLLPNYKDVMQQFIKDGKELVVCTHGKAGASLLLKTGEWIEQPAAKNMQIVDSNGAGDSFFCGFLYGWLTKQPPLRSMQYGAVCGALAVTEENLVYSKLSVALIQNKLDEYFSI